MQLQPIEKVSGLGRETFESRYLDPLKPVVFKDLIQDWPARDQWTFEFFRSRYGHLEVPIYDSSFSQGGKGYMSSSMSMKFADYLDLIEKGPTQYRIFLWNIFKHAPELAEYIRPFTIMNGFINELPFMFFGGQGSYTKIHYDIDCSHVFLTQFQTRKRVLLFDQDQSKYLQHVPFTVGCLVNPIDPDENKYPTLRHIKGWETVLEHGETLFIPSMYWHHIEYTDSGFSIALRASNSLGLKLKGAYHLVRHMAVDRGMNFILGKKWEAIKVNMAKRRSEVHP
ncbi:MAG TPA: cupin-like domain-containing protein [Saprospiraceae bacterium]|nr:cupin-like domain-containing protein [Saprospiraceae bacterium]